MRRISCALAAILALVAQSALAQSSERVWRLGVLSPGDSPFIRRVTLPELARRGFVEGRNLVVEERVGTTDRLPELAREIVQTKPDAIIAVSNGAIRALHQATSTIPIVMSFIGEDPVAAGAAASLRRPGGNITGQMMLAPELDGKRLQLLHEAVPAARRIGVLAADPLRHRLNVEAMQAFAAAAGIELVTVFADEPQEFAAAIARLQAAGAKALAIASAPELAGNAGTLASLATAAGMPTVCEWDYMAREGCLLGYGPDNPEMRRRTADYVVRLFEGASPGDLPIEGPTRFAFAVNLRTARALSLEVPQALLLRADDVIE